jgi:hypothetical protein
VERNRDKKQHRPFSKGLDFPSFVKPVKKNRGKQGSVEQPFPQQKIIEEEIKYKKG